MRERVKFVMCGGVLTVYHRVLEVCVSNSINRREQIDRCLFMLEISKEHEYTRTLHHKITTYLSTTCYTRAL